jgi:hypothetical protein
LQLTINAADPARLAHFWARALGYQSAPPTAPDTPWNAHYRARRGPANAFENRIFDPAGLRPPIYFQHAPEVNAGKNGLHLDLYPTGRDEALPFTRRVELVEAKISELVELDATIQHRHQQDDPHDPYYWVVMRDPEGNEFCMG